MAGIFSARNPVAVLRAEHARGKVAIALDAEIEANL
jgi:hypothetical protein